MSTNSSSDSHENNSTEEDSYEEESSKSISYNSTNYSIKKKSSDNQSNSTEHERDSESQPNPKAIHQKENSNDLELEKEDKDLSKSSDKKSSASKESYSDKIDIKSVSEEGISSDGSNNEYSQKASCETESYSSRSSSQQIIKKSNKEPFNETIQSGKSDSDISHDESKSDNKVVKTTQEKSSDTHEESEQSFKKSEIKPAKKSDRYKEPSDSQSRSTKDTDSKSSKSSKKSVHSEDSDTETESQSKKKKSTNSPPDDIQQEPFDFTAVSPNTPLNPKTDRFGWTIEDDAEEPTKKIKKLEKKENIKEKERETKWIHMMKKENWKKYYDKKGKHRKVLERRVIKGIPDCLRSRAWRLILDPHAIDDPERPSVDSYFDKGVPSCDYVIRVDIPRTMPRVPMFTRKDVRISLYRILRAYSNADPELGYYQGMAFTAALLMSYMDETNAFWSFVGLMKGKRHKLRDFYDNSFTKLKEINKVWDYLLLKKFKAVHDNLKKHNIEHLLYTASWFLCAFMNINFDIALKLRIFDRFALFGTRALISFGTTIVDMNKEELATGTFDVVIPILQNPHLTPSMKDWRKILKVYDKNFLAQSEYKQFFKKAGVKYF